MVADTAGSMAASSSSSGRQARIDARPIRVGIVGCGSVSNAYNEVIQPLRAAGVVEVTMACDSYPDAKLLDGSPRIDRIRRYWPQATFTADYREVVSSGDVDVVLVLTSMPAHHEVSRAALLAGKHVLVEKPMGTTLEQGADLVEIARTSRGYLVPAPHVILSPTYFRIWDRLRRGDIGTVLLARARYGHWAMRSTAWFFQKGGGAIFDLGVYNLTALTGLLGPARRVTAFAGVAVPDRFDHLGNPLKTEAVDNAHILLDFGGAVYASVTTGFTMHKYTGPTIELYGSKGVIQLGGHDWAPSGFDLWRPSDEDARNSFYEDDVPWEHVPEEAPDWPWMAGFTHLIDCLGTGRPPLVTPEHAYHVLEIMIAAEEAAADGCARPIGSTFGPLELRPPA